MKNPERTIHLDIDDSEIQKFYKSLQSQNVNIHLSLSDSSLKSFNKSLKDTVEKNLSQGIEKGGSKGATAFQKGFVEKLTYLDSQIKKYFVNPIESLETPIKSLFSGLSSLGGLFSGGGTIGNITSLVGELTIRLVDFTQANQKFRESLSSNLEIRNIEYLEKKIGQLTQSSGISREKISSFLVMLKEAGISSEDVTHHMNFLNAILPKIGKEGSQSFEKIVSLMKHIEEGTQLTNKEFKTLSYLVGDEVTEKIQQLGKQGKLTLENFSQSIEKLGKEPNKFLSQNLKSLSLNNTSLEYMRSPRSQVKAYGALEGSQYIPNQEDIQKKEKEVQSLIEPSFKDIEVKIQTSVDKKQLNNKLKAIREEYKKNPLRIIEIVPKIQELAKEVQSQRESSSPKEDSLSDKVQKVQDKWTSFLSLPQELQKQINNLSFNKITQESDALEKTLLGTIQKLSQRAQNREEWDYISLLSQSADNLQKTLPRSLDTVKNHSSDLIEKINKISQEDLKIETNPEIFDELALIKGELENIEKVKGRLTEDELEVYLNLKKEVNETEEKLEKKSSGIDNKLKDNIIKGFTVGSQTLSNIFQNFNKKDLVGTGLSVMGSLGQTATALKDIIPGGAIAGSVIGGITGIFSAVDSFMKAGIEREMEGIRKQDALFLDEYKKTKDKEIDERKKHIKELDEQFSKTKSVYDRAFEEGAISSEEYAHHMKGATEGYQKSKKEDEDAIEVATRQKQMLDNYISRREEIQKTKKETESSLGLGGEDSESAQKLARINEAINAIQTAKSIEDLNKYPEKAINYAYHGYQGYTSKPTLFMTSELGQKEHVNITPSYRLGEENSTSGVSIGNIEININGSGLSVNELSNELVDALFMRLQQRMQRGMYGGR